MERRFFNLKIEVLEGGGFVLYDANCQHQERAFETFRGLWDHCSSIARDNLIPVDAPAQVAARFAPQAPTDVDVAAQPERLGRRLLRAVGGE